MGVFVNTPIICSHYGFTKTRNRFIYMENEVYCNDRVVVKTPTSQKHEWIAIERR